MTIRSVVEQVFVDAANGKLWIEVWLNGKLQTRAGPFVSKSERLAAHDDLCRRLNQIDRSKN